VRQGYHRYFQLPAGEWVVITARTDENHSSYNYGGINIVPLAVCPECEAEIHVDEDVDKGEIITCEECEVTLEVVGLDPIELDLAPDEEEEDDYDEEEEY
jgi:alpha-aminoadipate/glutamate carrier protein LysW